MSVRIFFVASWAAAVASIEIVRYVGGVDLSALGNLALAFCVGIAFGAILALQRRFS